MWLAVRAMMHRQVTMSGSNQASERMKCTNDTWVSISTCFLQLTFCNLDYIAPVLAAMLTHS